MKFIYAALFALAFSSCATRQANTWIAKPTEKQYSGRAILVGPNISQEAVQSELLLWVALQDSAPNLSSQDLKRCIVADESLKASPNMQSTSAGTPTTSASTPSASTSTTAPSVTTPSASPTPTSQAANETPSAAPVPVPQPPLGANPETNPFVVTAPPPNICTPTPQQCVFVIDEKRSSVFSRSEPQRAQICVEKLKDSDHVLVDLFWPTQPVYWTTYAFQDLKANFDKKFGPDKVKFAQITRAQ